MLILYYRLVYLFAFCLVLLGLRCSERHVMLLSRVLWLFDPMDLSCFTFLSKCLIWRSKSIKINRIFWYGFTYLVFAKYGTEGRFRPPTRIRTVKRIISRQAVYIIEINLTLLRRCFYPFLMRSVSSLMCCGKIIIKHHHFSCDGPVIVNWHVISRCRLREVTLALNVNRAIQLVIRHYCVPSLIRHIISTNTVITGCLA